MITFVYVVIDIFNDTLFNKINYYPNTINVCTVTSFNRLKTNLLYSLFPEDIIREKFLICMYLLLLLIYYLLR